MIEDEVSDFREKNCLIKSGVIVDVNIVPTSRNLRVK